MRSSNPRGGEILASGDPRNAAQKARERPERGSSSLEQEANQSSWGLRHDWGEEGET